MWVAVAHSRRGWPRRVAVAHGRRRKVLASLASTGLGTKEATCCRPTARSATCGAAMALATSTKGGADGQAACHGTRDMVIMPVGQQQ